MEPLSALRGVLAETEALLSERRGQRTDLEQEIERLERDCEGLRSTVRRYEANPEVAPPGLDPTWRQLTRQEAILRLLAETGPIGPTEIAHQLTARGRPNENNSVVSSCLMKMRRRTGRVERIGWGLWNITEEPPATDNVVALTGRGTP